MFFVPKPILMNWISSDFFCDVFCKYWHFQLYWHFFLEIFKVIKVSSTSSDIPRTKLNFCVWTSQSICLQNNNAYQWKWLKYFKLFFLRESKQNKKIASFEAQRIFFFSSVAAKLSRVNFTKKQSLLLDIRNLFIFDNLVA